jgi:hypothetical protein
MATRTRKRIVEKATVTRDQLDTPDVTTVQVISGVGSVVGLLTSAAIISNTTGKLIVGVASIILPLAFTWADAHIRHGRSTGNMNRR